MGISENALKILQEKCYFQEGESTWEDICRRVAETIGSVEEEDALKARTYSEVFGAMSNLEFIFSTPTLLNAHKDHCGNLSSCFVLEVKDSIESICDMDAKLCKIFQKNGGAGASLGALRPAKTAVETSGGYAGGVISFMRKYDSTADEMTRFNPSRKGAIKIDLPISHPQIKDFIHCKDEVGFLARMNISVYLTDKFMNAVLNDDLWVLEFPDYSWDKEIYNAEWDGNIEHWKEKGYPVKTYEYIKAKDLYHELCESAWKTGEPGVSFLDRMNADNMNPHVNRNVGTNPCAEFTNIPWSSCNLASINISKFVKDGKFDWDGFKQLVGKSVRWMDNLITVNKLPLAEIDKVTKEIRPIGIGMMGYAEALYLMGIPYNSDEAYRFTDDLFANMYMYAVMASIELAEERGAYPAWEGSKWSKGTEAKKIRNGNLLSIAPTGSISIFADTSGGIEPVFALGYYRRTYDGNTYWFTNQIFENALKNAGIYSEELIEKVKANGGSCQGIPEIPADIQKVFVVAGDLNPSEHITTVAIAQKWVDLSISKTCNLPPTATIEDVEKVFMDAWKLGLKGVTIYRDGSRDFQTLSTTKKEEDNEVLVESVIEKGKVLRWGEVLDTDDSLIGKKRKIQTGCGRMHVCCYFDAITGRLVEVFLNRGGDGGCLSFIGATSRLISECCRAGVDIEHTVDQLMSVPACPSYMKRKMKNGDTFNGSSCPSAIAFAIKEMQNEMNDEMAGAEEEGEDIPFVIPENKIYVLKDTKVEKPVPFVLEGDVKPVVALNAMDVAMYGTTKAIEIMKGSKLFSLREKCPECGQPMANDGGCVSCPSCGFSRCG